MISVGFLVPASRRGCGYYPCKYCNVDEPTMQTRRRRAEDVVSAQVVRAMGLM